MIGIEDSTHGVNKLLECTIIRVMSFLLTSSDCYGECLLESHDKTRIDLTTIESENWCFVVLVEW